MSKCIKKILVFVTLFTIVFSSSALSSYASSLTEDEYISLEAFESSMNELYSKYDSSFKIVDDNNLEYISTKYADEMYQKAEKAFKEAELADKDEMADSLSQFDDQKLPRSVMPVPYYKEQTFKISGKASLGYAYFGVACYGTVNAQYGAFMDLTCSGVYRTGLAVNYQSFSLDGLQQYYVNGNTSYRVAFFINVNFAWTEPNTGMALSESVREYRSLPFPAS